jgi:ketosteroid isomerase-like protein
MEHEGIVPGKDGAYVILMRNLGRGRESGVDIDASVASLVHVHDGRIDRMEMFWDREAALAAAGVQGAT